MAGCKDYASTRSEVLTKASFGITRERTKHLKSIKFHRIAKYFVFFGHN